MRTPIIVADTREQRPFEFKGLQVVRRKLEVGDYSLRGLEDRVAVERKSLGDLWSTLSTPANLCRFQEELARATGLGVAVYVVVESSVQAALSRSRYSAMSPFRLMDRLHYVAFRHRALVTFAGGRREAEIVTLSILKGAWAEIVDSTAVV